MRRKDRMLPEADTYAILAQGEYGTLGTVCDDGLPYNTPVSYVFMEGRVYFHSAKSGRKLDNMSREPRVCFSVVGKMRPVYDGGFTTCFESAVAFGKASRVEDEGEKRRMLAALCEKYLPASMERFEAAMASAFAATDVWRIELEEITGKAKQG